MKQLRISAVSYINTLPFLFGIEKHARLLQFADISKDIPSESARKLLEGEVDLGLVPVAIIPKLDHPHIISDFCIGAKGRVKSVLLVSEEPLEHIKRVYLDYQSRTSVALCRILFQQHWNKEVEFLPASEGYESMISGDTAGVIIGDRTFHLEDRLQYRYDLSEAWTELTGLPFVFACWVSNKPLEEDFIAIFNEALAMGVNRIVEAVDHFGIKEVSRSRQLNYLTAYIDYHLDEQKRAGLQRFLEMINP